MIVSQRQLQLMTQLHTGASIEDEVSHHHFSTWASLCAKNWVHVSGDQAILSDEGEQVYAFFLRVGERQLVKYHDEKRVQQFKQRKTKNAKLR